MANPNSWSALVTDTYKTTEKPIRTKRACYFHFRLHGASEEGHGLMFMTSVSHLLSNYKSNIYSLKKDVSHLDLAWITVNYLVQMLGLEESNTI